jgi:hypothetical protein
VLHEEGAERILKIVQFLFLGLRVAPDFIHQADFVSLFRYNAGEGAPVGELERIGDASRAYHEQLLYFLRHH